MRSWSRCPATPESPEDFQKDQRKEMRLTWENINKTIVNTTLPILITLYKPILVLPGSILGFSLGKFVVLFYFDMRNDAVEIPYHGATVAAVPSTKVIRSIQPPFPLRITPKRPLLDKLKSTGNTKHEALPIFPMSDDQIESLGVSLSQIKPSIWIISDSFLLLDDIFLIITAYLQSEYLGISSGRQNVPSERYKSSPYGGSVVCYTPALVPYFVQNSRSIISLSCWATPLLAI